MMKGECHCGEVSYIINMQVKDVFICHCSLCRKSTGSGGIAVCIVPNANFKWLSGEEYLKYWPKPGHDWHTHFCMQCGSSLPGVNDENNMYVPVGTLTAGDEHLKVAHHLWVSSKASWECLCEGATVHQKGFGE